MTSSNDPLEKVRLLRKAVERLLTPLGLELDMIAVQPGSEGEPDSLMVRAKGGKDLLKSMEEREREAIDSKFADIIRGMDLQIGDEPKDGKDIDLGEWFQ